MKILTGATIGNILDYAIERLPTELLPTRFNAKEIPFDSDDSKSDEHLSRPSVEETTSVSSEAHTSVSSSKFSMIYKQSNVPPLIGLFPLSVSQLRFWFLQSLLEDKTTPNVSCLLSLKGPLLIHELQRSVATLAQRHVGLRTCFIQKDGKSWQGILKDSNLRLEIGDVTSQAEVAREFQKSKDHTFDLESGDTMKIILLIMAPELHYMIISYHHINMDGVSFMVLIRDLAKAYGGEELSQPLLQYPSFFRKATRGPR